MGKLESTEENHQLTIRDIETGKEFTIAQASSIPETHYQNERQLRVGDVIKIESYNETGFEVSINGHNKTRPLFIPFAQVGDYTVVNEQ